MSFGRVEAFSNRVIVILTIRVLELKAPVNGDPSALLSLKLPYGLGASRLFRRASVENALLF